MYMLDQSGKVAEDLATVFPLTTHCICFCVITLVFNLHRRTGT